VAIAASAPLLAAQALSGTLTVNGNLTVTNLSAQSITLGTVTLSNWPSSSGAGAIDLTSAVVDFSQTALLYRVTLTNNVSWEFVNHVPGRVLFLQITEDGTGGWTNSWPTGLLWPGGVVIGGNVSSNAISVYEVLDNGTSWLIQAEGLSYGAQCGDCYALEFDGSNYITVDQGSQWAPPQFTFEAWVKSNQGQPNGGNGALAATQGFAGAPSGWLAAFTQDGHFAFTGTMQNGSNFWVEGSTTINDGAWHHVAVTVNGSYVNLYVNGSPDGSPMAYGATHLMANAGLTLGALPGGTDYNYYGILDEVRISSSIRYTGPFNPDDQLTADSDTIALWTFSEGSGATAGDSTGSHNGTLAGNPTPAWVSGR
jgi:hypothetical protein